MKKIAIVIAMALAASLSSALPASADDKITLDFVLNDVDMCLDDKDTLINNDRMRFESKEPAPEIFSVYLKDSADSLADENGFRPIFETFEEQSYSIERDLAGRSFTAGQDYFLNLVVYLDSRYSASDIENIDEYDYEALSSGDVLIKLKLTNEIPANPVNCWGDDLYIPVRPAQDGYTLTIPERNPWYFHGRYWLWYDPEGWGGPAYGGAELKPSSKVTIIDGADAYVCLDPVFSDRGEEFESLDGALEINGEACWRYNRSWPADYNKFSLPYGRLNTKKATASLSFKVRAAGSVKLSGVGIKTQTKAVYSSGQAALTVTPDSKTLKSMKKKLKKKRSVSKYVKVKAVYYPAKSTDWRINSGKPYTVYKTYKLTLKRK
jgi:hypothetical protein